ncbi:MAG: PKD domain-containing protein [Acidobacteriota bacterium]
MTCVVVFLAAMSASATTIVMPSDEQLVAKTPLIVAGEVTSSTPVTRNGGHEIWTETVIAVERTLKGSAAKTLTVRETGGIVGDRITKVFGGPEYRVGEHVLAFLTPTPRGDYQTVDLFVGKFTEERTLAGQRLWARHDEAQDAALLDRDFVPIQSKSVERDAGSFEQFIGERVAGRVARANYGVENPLVERPAAARPGRGNIVSDFTLISEPTVYRWFAFDTGGVARWYSVGTQPGYSGGGVTEIQSAMAAWNSYSGAKINYSYAGTSSTPAGGLAGPNGVNEILFNDPKGEIAGTWDPSKGGVVGQGGFNGVSGTQNWTATFAADAQHPAGTFRAYVIVEGNLTVQDNVSVANGISSKALAEIVAHEFGHTLGFGHSTDASALMYPTLVGLGASLRTDDQVAARWLYPSGSVTTPPPATTAPAAPTNLVGTVNGTNLAMQWSDNATNETGQSVYASFNGSPFSKAVDIAAGQHSATLTGFTPGSWRLYLTAYNAAGESAASNTIAFAIAAPLTALFTVSSSTGSAGSTVFSFTDQSTGGVTSRSWDFGDGFTSTAANPTHVYSVAGAYNVVLTVSGGGAQSQASRLITISAALPGLAAAFSYAPSAPRTAQDVTFTDQSTGGVTSWAWSFGDGTSSSQQNPTKHYNTAGLYGVILTIFRNSESATVSHTVNVGAATPAAVLPVASFDIPSGAQSGQSVAFSDRSTDATSWSWNFGDGSVSSLQSPSHTYAAPGTYSVILTVSNATGTSAISHALVVGSNTAPFRSLVPVTAATSGVGGSTWRTELTIFNAGSGDASVKLVFLNSAGGPPPNSLIVLGSRQSVTYVNALLDIFGVASGAGAITVEATNPSGSPLLEVSSRTFTNGSTGTYGQSVPDVSAAALQSNLFLTGLESDSAFRSNLGLVNQSPNDVFVSLALSDVDGITLGTTNVSVPANSFQQSSLVSFFPAVGGVSYGGMSLRISASSAGAVSVYASVIDNRTQDPVYIQATPMMSGNSLVLPAVGRAAGANATLWRSDVTFFNPSSSWINANVRFLAANSDNRSAPSKELTLAPGRTLLLADVLNWLGLSSGSGAFELTWSGPNAPIVASRTYTTAADGGTYGQSIDPIAAYSRDVYVTGLRSDSSFRSNLGFVNGGDISLPATLQLLASDGRVLATSSLTLSPRSQTQSSMASLFPALSSTGVGTFTLVAHAGSASLFAYGSIVDNASGDPVFYAGK